MNHKLMHTVTFILLVIGGLNWLFYAVGYNLIGILLGGFFGGIIADVVYILVGLAAIYEAMTHKTNCRTCAPAQTDTMAASHKM